MKKYLLNIFILWITKFITFSSSKLLILSSSEFYHLYQLHQRNQIIHENDLNNLEYNFMRRRNLIQAPDEELLSFYQHDLLHEALKLRNSSITFDAGVVWTYFMEELMTVLSSPESVSKLDRYAEMGWSPVIFTWYFGNAEVTEYFEQNGRILQSHPLWDSLWHRALATSFSYMHGRVPISVKLPSNLRLNEYEDHPGQYFYYRAEAVQLVFNHMILHNTLGLLPHQLSQVVEFGGGTGFHAALLPSLGFNGIHFVYDLPPMLLLQQFFLSYSGWPSYPGEKLYEADMKNLDNPNYESVSAGKNFRGRQIILGTSLL